MFSISIVYPSSVYFCFLIFQSDYSRLNSDSSLLVWKSVDLHTGKREWQIQEHAPETFKRNEYTKKKRAAFLLYMLGRDAFCLDRA